MKIKTVVGKQIKDSKGDPTLEVQVMLENGVLAFGGVPSGASTGKHEAVELPADKAVINVNTRIADLLTGRVVSEQKEIDDLMIKLDGSENKSNLGANAIVGTSMAVARAAALSLKIPLYRYIGQLANNNDFYLPQPMVLAFEGGKHGDWVTDIQEYLVIPKKSAFDNFEQMYEAGKKVFLKLQDILKERDYDTGLGFEGAFCPRQLKSNEEVFRLLEEAVKGAGFLLNKQFVLGIDAAAEEFFKNGNYVLKSEDSRILSSKQWIEKIISWLNKYAIWSLEDVFGEEEWQSWSEIMSKVGNRAQVVGDDLLTTNVERIKKAIQLKAVNAVLIKVNQIGTVTETLEAVKITKQAGWESIVSHRAGETMDDFIADLCVGAGCGQCKFGGPTKSERKVKYDRLLEIERELNNETNKKRSI